VRYFPLLVLALASASPAASQIRLPKPKLPVSVPSASSVPTRQPTYDDRVVMINDSRATGLLRGLKVEQDQRPALERGYKKNADDRAAAEVAFRRQTDGVNRWQACMMTAIGIDTVAQRRLDERMQAARDRNDERTVKRLEDSVANAMMTKGPDMAMAQQAAMQPGGKCGPQPDPSKMQPMRVIPEPSKPLADSLVVLGAGAAGLTPEQYAVMKERVLAYLTTATADLGRSSYVWGPTELSTLHSKRSEFVKFQEYMTEH